MTDTAGAPATDSASSTHGHPSMQDLFSYPLMSALTERRTRRIPRGFSVKAGPLSYESSNQPEPLTPLEEAILVTCITGITGITTHDGPLTKANGSPELGTPFLNVLARTGSSADNCQATHFFMINDDGIFLLKHPTGTAALEAFHARPRKWADWSDEDWLTYAEQCKVRISDKRLSFPREWPYYLGWNAQASNVAGTTLFYPVVDCTWQYINALLILANEPDGKRSMFMDDWRPFHPKGFVEWMAKIGGTVHLMEKIPYQPIGGLKYVRNKFVTKDNVGAAGLRAHAAHGLRVVLLLPEPDAARPGHGPRRVDPRRRLHAVHVAARARQGLARPRLPDGAAQDPLAVGARSRPRSPTPSASTASSRASPRRT